jgi:hypothetical protein
VRHIATAAMLLALAACKVERTPRDFYTVRDPGIVERQEAQGEIRDRVRNFAEHLGRGDRADAVEAVAPVDLAQVIGVDGNAGLNRLGPNGLMQALDSVALPAPAVARTPDLQVQVGLREGMGSFATHVELLPMGAGTRPLRMRATGVFVRDRGSWRLSQIHLSHALVPPPADSAASDTAARDTADADSTP